MLPSLFKRECDSFERVSKTVEQATLFYPVNFQCVT